MSSQGQGAGHQRRDDEAPHSVPRLAEQVLIEKMDKELETIGFEGDVNANKEE